jgi:lipoate-protein ligase A
MEALVSAKPKPLALDALYWDGGVASASRQRAYDNAQRELTLERHCALLRVHRYLPGVALGRHERASQAARVDYCREAGIEMVRRPTGGGAVYLDPGQIAWTLTAPRSLWAGTLAELLAALASGQALALRTLGIDARYASPNDIEVEGRKLGSVFASLEDDHLIAQGTLLLDLDMRALLSALRVPKEKLSPEGIQSARERFATLNELNDGTPLPPSRLLGCMREGAELALGHAFRPSLGLHGQLGLQAGAASSVDERESEAAEAFTVTAGGVVHARVVLDARGSRLARLEINGDVDVQPGGLLCDLADALQGVSLEDIDTAAAARLAGNPHELVGFEADQLTQTIRLAAARARQQRSFHLDLAQANTLMVHDPGGPGDAQAILAKAEVMLVPYCAKPAWCELRHEDDCTECGLCEVSEAYRLAREHGIPAVTIQNFEHLEATLAELKAAGVNAYVGMCCQNFYIKRAHAFHRAGMPAVLLDIEGSNCYELQQEDLAYKGEFKAEARLNEEVLEKVMRFVPRIGV